ncbi:MAG: hypothetical protein KAH38_00885 [Candidatus Hydrogenedentes bacterium]|nr:hypothetical protein [Candidatus Hydrogenedentota bacterium]
MPVIVKKKTAIFDSKQVLLFHDTSHYGLLFAGVIFAFIAGYVALPKGSDHNELVVLIPGSLAVLLIARAIWQQYFKSEETWFIAIDSVGLHINLGYSAGYSTGQCEVSSLFVPHEEIRHIGCLHEKMRLPHRFGATRHHFGYLDIALREPVSGQVLRETLYFNEGYAKTGKSGPFPTRFLNPLLIRLNWNAVYPSEVIARKELSKRCSSVKKRDVVFPDWGRLDRSQRDVFLDELWAMGMRNEALFLARLHLKISLKNSEKLLCTRFESAQKKEED